MGCANAYMRCYEQKTDSLTVTASDMPDYVRRGLLSIKEHRTEIEELIPQNYNFSFSSQGVHAQRLETSKTTSTSTLTAAPVSYCSGASRRQMSTT